MTAPTTSSRSARRIAGAGWCRARWTHARASGSPTWPPFRSAYTGYLMRALPAVARRVATNPDAYVYLAESIRAWPDQAALARRIDGAGWADSTWSDLSYGIVAVHRARKP